MSFGKFFAVTASMLVAASLFAAGPAEAKKPKKVPAPYALSQIDRNKDRNISSKEWDWAEKKGYDRLTKKGAKVNRKAYQARVNAYYQYVDRYNARYDDDDHNHSDNGPGFAPGSAWQLHD